MATMIGRAGLRDQIHATDRAQPEFGLLDLRIHRARPVLDAVARLRRRLRGGVVVVVATTHHATAEVTAGSAERQDGHEAHDFGDVHRNDPPDCASRSARLIS